MGLCFSCCDDGSGPDAEAYRKGTRSRPDTEADRQARAAAAAAAAQRQATYEQSAVGRATTKSVKAAKAAERYNQRETAADLTKDWMN